MNQFIERMVQYDNIKLYVVELAYGEQEFMITNPTNPNHLQLRTKYALWHKENLINLGINKLLPKDWKAVAWIDGDIEFENLNWVDETLKVLTNFDLVQLFTTCFDLDEYDIPMNIWQGYGYKYCNGEIFKHNKGVNYWHSGYAWACTRTFYDQMGKIYDKGIVGSGDYILTQAIIGNVACADKSLTDFKDEIIQYKEKLNNYNLKIGYITSNIKHYFHGSKVNRKYVERNQILIKNKYSPTLHLEYDDNGVIIPTKNMSPEFIKDIKDYFFQRNEDEYYELIYKNINSQVYYFNINNLNKISFKSIIYIEDSKEFYNNLTISLFNNIVILNLHNGTIKGNLNQKNYDDLFINSIISIKTTEKTGFYSDKILMFNLELLKDLNLVKITIIHK
jgi:hypothetical protein